MIDGSRDIFNTTPANMPNDPDGVIWTIDAFNTSPEKDNFKYDHVTSTNNIWSSRTAVSSHYNGGIRRMNISEMCMAVNRSMVRAEISYL
jgi:hypothetical protein